MTPFVPAPLPDRENERLQKLRDYGVLDTPAETEFDDFTALASQIVGTPIALISLLDEQRQWFKSRVGLDVDATARDISFCGHAIHNDDLFVVEDAQTDQRFAGNPLVVGAPHIRFYAGCPLVTPDGFALGTLCVIDRQPRQLSAQAADTLRKLGRQLVNLLELRRLLQVQRETEQRLRQREAELQRLALVAERTHNVVIMSDPDGIATWVNPAFERVTGYTLADIIGRKPGDVLQFEGTSIPAKQTLGEAVRLRQAAHVQLLNQGKFGDIYWMDVDLQPLIAEDGEFLGFVAIETDITELVRRREHQDALIEALPLGLVLQDKDARLQRTNSAALRILGLSPGEPLKPLPTAMHELAARTLDSGNPCANRLVPIHNAAGASRWLEVSAALLPGTYDRPDGVVLAFNDQTEKIDAGRYVELASITADVGYWTWTLPEDRLEMSDSWVRGLGLPGNTVPTRHFVHPDDQSRNREAIVEVLKGCKQTFKFEERLQAGDGTWRWVLCGGAVTERNSHGRVTRLSGIHLNIDEQKRAEDALKRAATTDPLTGLPNRLLLRDRLERALTASRRHGRIGALLFLDLDHFKRVNDSYGHSVGDQLLNQIAARLKAELRSEDTLARMGGDEMLVLLPELEANLPLATAQAQGVALKLLRAFQAPFNLGERVLQAGASIGISLFPKSAHETSDDLIREADTAMYGAKADSRGSVRVFEASMQSSVTERLRLDHDLRLAIQNGEFELHVQGKWTPDEQLAGGEALLRWHHPERGWVSPVAFIPAAEESELIQPIGRWVLEQACAMAHDIRTLLPDFVLSVNLSPKQFHNPDFAAELRQILAQARLPNHALMLEITEGVLLQAELAQQLVALSQEGFRFSLDDFGTGYSSLAYLKRLPVHELKIDRAFVRDIEHDDNDAALVQAVLSIAQRFRIHTVAEGVETHAQAVFLSTHGCELLQGYFFDKPQPWSAFMARARAAANRHKSTG
jgi:diguanylate cyclase (GGDEF)-like protein/PAS domain S-box-containing protein